MLKGARGQISFTVVFPESVALVASEKFGGQDRAPLARLDFPPNFVQAGRAEPLVEFDHVVGWLDVVRVVGVKSLAYKAINRGEGAERVGDEALVAHEEQPIRPRAIDRFPQRVEGRAVHAGGRRKPFDARIDCSARIVVEDPGKLEGVAADEALDAVQNPSRIAHATDQLRAVSGRVESCGVPNALEM